MDNSKFGTINKISAQYSIYHAGQITTNRFTHASFIQELASFKNNNLLSITTIGYSHEGRKIKSIRFGSGKIKVLLWSQMHGNESTATRAILDLLNFLTANDEFNSFRDQLVKKLTLQFIPMLNPDGTEHFQRRTSTEIDMNRDAVALQSPEGKMLMNMINEFKPYFAFNLHDQRRFYNVKETAIPSSISFLAPAYNKEREINASREKAMQLIAGMNSLLQAYIPNGVGLYDDTYSYRSFGDCIQAKGISTILIESGWLPNDMEKEGVRKLNFTAILAAFEMLANDSFKNYSITNYVTIPAIDDKLFDVLIKDVCINNNLIIDIGIHRTEHLINHPNYYTYGQVSDLGDLSKFYGFETINAKGLTVVSGKFKTINNLNEISLVSVKRLLRQGILFLITEDIPYENFAPFPINIAHPRKIASLETIKFEENANFLLVDKNKTIKYIILNGFIIKPEKIDPSINGLIIV